MGKIPYGKQKISEDDINEIIKVLKSDFLTTGPKIDEFEKAFANYLGVDYAVAVSSGTSALHLACLCLDLDKEDEVIVSPMSFAASANCVLYCNGKPVFVDVDEEGLIDINKIEEKITDKTKAIIPVHYSGLVCDMDRLNEIAKKHNLKVIEDACHALGSRYKHSQTGNCHYSDMCIFSFHPVKHITSGEGGMITTNSKELYERLKTLRNQGIVKMEDWYYEMPELGFNYRLTDIQSALGLSQLKKLNGFVSKRREIAQKYGLFFSSNPEIEILNEKLEQFNSYHLYVIKLKNSETRKKLYNYLKSKDIFCQVHYIPIYWHPHYHKLGYEKGLCVGAEEFYSKILSLPIYPDLKEDEQERVIEKINEFFQNENVEEVKVEELDNEFKEIEKTIEKQKKTGVIIQARMASTRLPNKIMLDLGGKEILWQVVEQCKKANVDDVIVATSTNPENDIIEKFCKENNYSCFRGSENNVLSRYYEAAKKFELDVVVRVTSDCPLISPEVINACLDKMDEENTDYASNLAQRSFPRGVDIESFKFETLEKTYELVTDDFQKEHVTPFIYNSPEIFKISHLVADESFEKLKKPEYRLTVDTEDDLKLLKIIFNNLYHEKGISIYEVIDFLDENPEFAKMNTDSEEEHLKRSAGLRQRFVKA